MSDGSVRQGDLIGLVTPFDPAFFLMIFPSRRNFSISEG
jgi:hypothetical protein